MRRVGLAVLMALGAMLTVPRAAAAPADACGGAPADWTAIPQASGMGGTTLLCNYSVTRTVNGRKAVSGVAITIEYYCASGDAQQAFRGKTGKRDTETLRTSGKVASQEGPQAKNPDNPQRDGVFSTFFPGITFGLFEKEWALFAPPQAVGTFVVLTNEKGTVPEPKRFGVRDAEAVANTLAAANAGRVPGCSIPKSIHIPGAATPNSSSGSDDSSSTIPILIGIGGVVGGTVVVVVVVNGRRKRARPKFRKPRRTERGPNVFDPTIEQQRQRWNTDQQVWDPATQTYRPYTDDDLELLPDDDPDLSKQIPRDQVPETCRGIYDQVQASQSELKWLDDTLVDQQKKLAQLELEFRQNQARASIQVSLDIAQGASAVVGGLTGAAKSALITNAGRAGARAAQAAAGEAGGSLDDLIRRRNILNALENSPAVSEARQLNTYWKNKLNTAITDLPKAELARGAYNEAKALETARANAIRVQAAVRDPLVREIAAIEGEMEWIQARAASQLGPMEANLANLDRQIRSAQPTLGGRGPVDAARAAKLAELQARRVVVTGEMNALQHPARLTQLQSTLATKQGALANASQGWDEINKAFNQARAAREKAFVALHGLEDVTAADVARLRNVQAQAFQNLSMAELAARSANAAELASLDTKIAAVRTALAKLAKVEVPSLPVRAVNTLVGPLVGSWRKAFGAGDSPAEMLEILLKYRVAILTQRANIVQTTQLRQQLAATALPALQNALTTCMQANAPKIVATQQP